MQLLRVISFVILCQLCVGSPDISRRDEQVINGAIANNAASADSQQLNQANINGNTGGVGNNNIVAITNNVVTGENKKPESGNVQGSPAAPSSTISYAAASPSSTTSGVTTNNTTTNNIIIANTNQTNNITSNTLNQDTTNAAGVTNNQVNGGIQHNNAVIQSNHATGNQNILGSNSDSHNIYNDNRTVTSFNQNQTNMNITNTKYHNVTELVKIDSHNENSTMNNVTNNEFVNVERIVKPGVGGGYGGNGQQVYVPSAGGSVGSAVQDAQAAYSNNPKYPCKKRKAFKIMLDKIKELSMDVASVAGSMK
ncbi:hypothetical protein HDU76_009748 [Blyttiomyces sp. JEL0837]|nr:hypothetical protein HDU76_009748 [Blyttiomyces sp. JEL0837]